MRRMRYRSLSRAEKFNLLPLPRFAVIAVTVMYKHGKSRRGNKFKGGCEVNENKQNYH